MSAVGLIRFYEVGGDRYLEVVNFDREQPGLHKRTKSDYPDPPEDLGNSRKLPEIPKTSGKSPEFPQTPGKFPEIPEIPGNSRMNLT